jgi:predicted RNase H-like nuclease (RuvC/YqgF family)
MERENLKGQIAILKKKLMEYETNHQNAEILSKRITEEAHISEMYQKERDGYQEKLRKVQDMLERAITENSTMKLSVHQYEIEKSRFITEIEHLTSRIEQKEREVWDVKNGKSSDIERLEEKLKMAIRERESLAGQMESLTDRNRNTQRGASDEKMLMVEENKRLKDELSRMEYQRNEHQANFNEADRKILESRDLVEQFNGRIKELEARLQETRAKNEHLNDELFQVKRELAEYQDGTRAPDNVYALQRENKDIALKLREANIKIADL